jgi:prepilin-type N-terminal cleavage/methylation domain-containing protein
MKKMKYKPNDKGFSLVEVIVSITLLAIILVPLLNYFVSSAKYSSKAKTNQKAVVLAQSILEQCKDKSIDEIALSFHTDTDFIDVFNIVDPSRILNPTDSTNPESMVEEVDANGSSLGNKDTSGNFDAVTKTFKNPTDGKVYYVIKNIQEDDNSYDALISIDTNNTLGDTYYAKNNSEEIYNINAINSPENLVAVESSQKARAVNQMIAINVNECATQNALHLGDASWTNLIQSSETEITNALSRIMTIEINPITGSTTTAKVKIYYKYYCVGIPGCPDNASIAVEIEPPLYYETVELKNMKNIYLFFNRVNLTEEVEINIDSTLDSYFDQKFNLYLIAQADATGNVISYNANVKVRDTFSYLYNVYSNADHISKNGAAGNIKSNEGYITKSSTIRLMNIKVDIYKAGKLLDPDYLYATLDSTKGE